MKLGRVEWFGAALAAVWAGALLCYGAVAPWALAGTAAALAGLNVAAARLLPEPLQLSRPAALFLAGCAAVFAAQLLPGTGTLFPFTARLREAHGVAAGGLAPGTADLFLTARALAQIAAYALTGLLVLRLLRNWLRPSRVFAGACVVLLLQAAYALAQVAVPLDFVPFYGERPFAGSASGTFVNRNSFGGLMSIGLCLAIGLAVSRFARGGPKRLEAAGLWAVAAVFFAVCVLLSRSRGAAIAAAAGALVVPFAARGRAAVAGAAAAGILAVVAGLLAHPAGLLARFEAVDPFDIAAQQRFRYWETTLDAWKRQPLLGFGVGTHPRAYHPFQPAAVPGQIEHPHNEYVNLLFEGGPVWLGLLLAGAAWWLATTARRAAKLDGPSRATVAGAIGAAVAVLAHALVDFDLRITAIGMAFAATLAAGAVPSAADPRWRGGPAVAGSAAAAILGALALALSLSLTAFGLDPNRRVDAAIEADDPAAARGALAVSPYDHRAAWLWGRAAEREGDPARAAGRFATAADLWPAHPDLQREAGPGSGAGTPKPGMTGCWRWRAGAWGARSNKTRAGCRRRSGRSGTKRGARPSTSGCCLRRRARRRRTGRGSWSARGGGARGWTRFDGWARGRARGNWTCSPRN
jgi:hypothetical protein